MKALLGGLRGQLVALMAGSMLVTLTALALYMVREQTQLARESIAQQAAATARSIALGGENDLVTGRLDVLEELLVRSADQPGVQRVLLVDARGAVLAQVVRDRGPGPGQVRPVYAPPGERLTLPAGTTPTLTESADGELVTAWEPVLAGTLLAWVRVDHDTASLATIRQGIWRGAIGACALALLGTLLLLLGLLRRPLAAIDQARDFAIDLGQATGRQLAAHTGAREVRELVAALNSTSAQLAQQREAIAAQVGQLRRQETELAERHERLVMLFALCPDGIVSFGADGEIAFVNPAFCALIGQPPEAVVGRDLAWLDARMHAASERPQAWTPLARVFEPADGAGPPRVLARLVRPRVVDLALLGVCGEGEAPLRLLYARDITHETEVDRLKSEFLSTAAHELRTPMTSIYGFTELLRTRDFGAERRTGILEKVHRQCGVMMAILNELLDLARIESRGAQDFEIVPADLRQVVHEAVADFAVPAGGLPPLVAAAAAPLPVRIDTAKLGQVMRNLLSNAFKYSPDGGEVQVRLVTERQEAVVEVQDHGIGMAPEQVARVCERFYRADASGAILGTGLGMSIVKEIVELHGGRLVLRSAPGEGTLVQVRLPLAPPDPGAAALPPPGALVLAPPEPRPARDAVLVD